MNFRTSKRGHTVLRKLIPQNTMRRRGIQGVAPFHRVEKSDSIQMLLQEQKLGLGYVIKTDSSDPALVTLELEGYPQLRLLRTSLPLISGRRIRLPKENAIFNSVIGAAARSRRVELE